MANEVPMSKDNPMAGALASDKNSEYFGAILYELKESESSMGGMYSRNYRVVFYEKVVLIQDENRFLCYPTSYTQEVHLKYKLSDVSINKAKVPTWLFWVSLVLFIVAIVLFVEEETGGGVACLIFSLIGFVFPFLLVKYMTTFTMIEKKKPDSIAGLVREMMTNLSSCMGAPDAGAFHVVTTREPDQDFLFNYVYGVMGAGMQKFHAFSHLANDGLSEVIEPKSLKDLDAMA